MHARELVGVHRRVALGHRELRIQVRDLLVHREDAGVRIPALFLEAGDLLDVVRRELRQRLAVLRL